jgi:predicted DNA binding CopG/RHH family protein
MMQTADVRERLFTMRMSDEEWTRATRLAEHKGLNIAGLIRMLLKDYERQVADELAPPAKPPKARR